MRKYSFAATFFIVALCAIFFIPVNASAAACTATTTGNWNTGSNWTGCTGAGGIPASGDTVTINSGITITLDTAPTVASITINGTLDTNSTSSFALTTGSISISATGTFKANASTVTLNGTTGTLFTLTSGGTFTAGTSTVTAIPDAAVTITSGTPTFFNLVLAPTNTAARTYTLNGNAITVANNFTINPTASSIQALTVNLGAALTVTGTTLIKRTTSATASLNTTSASHFAFTTGALDIETGGTYAENASVTTFTGNSGTILTNNGGSYSTGGSEIFNGNGDITLSGGTSTEHLNGVTLSPILTASHTYTLGTGINQVFGNVNINPAGGFLLTVNMSVGLVIGGALTTTPTGGATTLFDTTGSNFSLSVTSIGLNVTGSTFKAEASTITLTRSTTGNVIAVTSGATFNAGTSTVIMTGDGSPTLTSGTVPFYNLTLSPTITANRTYTFGAGTINIGNNFTINPTAASALSLTVVLDGTTNVTGTTLVEGSSSASGILNEFQGATNFTFTSGTTTTGSGGTINTSAPVCSATTTGNWSTGGNWSNCTGAGGIPATTDNVVINSGVTITLDTAPTIKTLTINGTLNTSSTSNFALTASTVTVGATGTFTANASTITVNGVSGTLFAVTSGGTFTTGTSTVIMNGDATLTATSGAVSFYNLTISPTITAARAYTFGSSALSIGNNLTINPTASSIQALTVTLGAAATVTGTTLIERTTSATASLTTSSGNNYAFTTGKLDIETGGTYAENASVTTFTGNSGTIVTDNGIYSSSGSEIFNGNGDITLTTGATSLHLNGVTLSPTLTANHTYTLGTGLVQVFGNVSINPSAASAFTLAVNMSGALSMFSLSLTPTVSATATFDTTTSNYALTAANIALNVTGDTFNANASIITLTRTTSGNALATVSGASFNAGTSTIIMTGDGSPIITSNNIPFSFYNLTLSPTLTANRTYTFGTKTVTITNNFTINPTAASALTLTVDLGNTTTVTGATLIEGTTSGSALLDTVSSSNFPLTSGAVDIEAGGTLNAENSIVTVGGNWTNNGTFTAGNSIVTLNSATTATILGPTTFYNLSITPAAAKEVDFSINPSDIITVTNIFSARGSSGNVIKLHSVLAGTQWHFDPTGVASADWVDVQDGACQPGAVNISAADYTNNGNNSSCWTQVSSVPFGTTYYVDPSGSDSNNGTSMNTPWQTLTKVNAATFIAGDQILFKDGGTWTGELIPPSSGNSSHSITFGSYGSGAKPIISGLTTLSSWTSLGGGIYESSCTGCAGTLNTVTLNGVPQALGRYPNADAANGGYLTVTSHSGTTSITDTALPSSPDWTGAQVVIRKTHWIIDKNTITSQSGHTITYTSPSTYAATDGFGYFIQNDPRTLDELGEWYYNPSTQEVEMYFGTNDPATYAVAASTVPTTVSVSAKNYITFDGLAIQGADTASVNLSTTQGVTIQNSAISNSGTDGIIPSNSTFLTLQNSSITNTFNNAFKCTNCSNTSITNNQISNTGTLAGMGTSGDNNYFAIYLSGNNNTIQSNTVTNSGYIPIAFYGNSVVVQNNYVDHFAYVKDDGGGIYSYDGGGSPANTDRHIINNIVVNGTGANAGTTATSGGSAVGIYLDDDSQDVTVTGNTVGNSNTGIFLHNDVTVTVTGNTVYNSSNQLFEMEPDSSGINMRGITVTNNNFISAGNSQFIGFILPATNGDTMTQYGTMDNNYYSHPSTETNIFSTAFGTSSVYTLTQWQTAFTEDANSHEVITPVGTTFVFLTNVTTAPTTSSLAGTYTDVRGNTYSNSITLQPFTSAILTLSNSGTNSTPAPVVSSGGQGYVSGGGPAMPITVSIPAPLPIAPIVSMSSPMLTFTLNLSLGSKNNQVLLLQKYLNTHGFVVAKTGVGSVGHETTMFGPATKSALIKFQKSKKISPASGYFGPLTRAFIAK